MPRIVIVGGGISGLAAAYRLRQRLPHAELVVLEADARPGGNVRTEHDRGFTVELGPNGFLDSKPATVDLCRDLGLGDRLVAASEGSRKNRFLYLNDRLHKLPGSLLGVLGTPLLTFAGKLKLLTEPLRAKPHRLPADESVAAFARRRFGREAADTFVDALVTGIHGGDPHRLSVAAAFPRLPRFEREHGSVVRGFLRAAKQRSGPTRMWSFAGGLTTLIDALAAVVPVRTGVAVRRLEKSAAGWVVRGDGRDAWPADAVVLTCPAPQQSELLADVDAALAAEIAGIGYAPIAVVAVGYRREQVPHPLDGFGYIAPQRTRRDALGVQWCSSIFPGRAPPGFVLWRALCGGVNRPDAAAWDDETLVRKVRDELRTTMKVRGDPAFVRVARWPRAIPQYVVGHLGRVSRIEALAARHAGLALGGNAYHGVALNDCTEQAERVADRLVGRVEPSRPGT